MIDEKLSEVLEIFRVERGSECAKCLRGYVPRRKREIKQAPLAIKKIVIESIDKAYEQAWENWENGEQEKERHELFLKEMKGRWL